MTTLKTERTEYAVRFLSAPGSDSVIIHMDDTRLVSAIAAEFEKIGRFTAEDTMMPGRATIYEGYDTLQAIERYADGSVMIRLGREGD